tara:strand:+ start:716 stop:1213 length:498 start_codon:yes stop_codon:yes gene_type:complete
VKNLVGPYESLRKNLDYRSEENVYKLLKSAEKHSGFLGLYELSQQITINLNKFENKIEVRPVRLFGKLPNEVVADRDFSGYLKINNQTFEIVRQAIPKENKLSFNFPVSEDGQTISLRQSNRLGVRIDLEQHLFFKNRHFEGIPAQKRSGITQAGTRSNLTIPVH